MAKQERRSLYKLWNAGRQEICASQLATTLQAKLRQPQVVFRTRLLLVAPGAIHDLFPYLLPSGSSGSIADCQTQRKGLDVSPLHNKGSACAYSLEVSIQWFVSRALNENFGAVKSPRFPLPELEKAELCLEDLG
jgi:hypothetical protein